VYKLKFRNLSSILLHKVNLRTKAFQRTQQNTLVSKSARKNASSGKLMRNGIQSYSMMHASM